MVRSLWVAGDMKMKSWLPRQQRTVFSMVAGQRRGACTAWNPSSRKRRVRRVRRSEAAPEDALEAGFDGEGQRAVWESAGCTRTGRNPRMTVAVDMSPHAFVVRGTPARAVVVVGWRTGRKRGRGIEGHMYCPWQFFFARLVNPFAGGEGGGRGVMQG